MSVFQVFLAAAVLCGVVHSLQLPLFQGSWSDLSSVNAAGAPEAASAESFGIPGQYIVAIDAGTGTVAATKAAIRAHTNRFIRTRNFKRSASFKFPSSAASAGAGFHTFTLSCTLEQLATVVGIPGLLAIEQDAIVSLNGTLGAMGGSARRLGVTNGTFQLRAVAGLDRIDQAVGPLNGVYKYAYDGAGVRVYVVDTGIRTTHKEFGGRAVKGIDLVNAGGSATDCNGHGTHVAGTVGGATYGVAKKAKLVAASPKVATMSLSGGMLTTVNQAVAALVSAGITVVVAAGNNNKDARSYSPGSESSVITVGATSFANGIDARASFSNFGTRVDLFAPGVDVVSAAISSDTAIQTLSGTSMAAPHVTGAIALLLQETPSLTPVQVVSRLTTACVKGLITDAKGAPNCLLQTNGVSVLECTSSTDCSDANVCTTDACSTSGLCSSTRVYSGACCVAKSGACTTSSQCCGGGRASKPPKCSSKKCKY